jgi:hypothetical protein
MTNPNRGERIGHRLTLFLGGAHKAAPDYFGGRVNPQLSTGFGINQDDLTDIGELDFAGIGDLDC